MYQRNTLPTLLRCAVLSSLPLQLQAVTPVFVDVTSQAQVAMQHQSSQTVLRIEDQNDNSIRPLGSGVANQAQLMSSWLTGGVAAGDYDGDGWDDLFVIGGDQGQSKLFRNLGDGSFEDVTAVTGLDNLTGRIAGAVFADVDNDHDLDLFIGGALGQAPRLLMQTVNASQRQFIDNFSNAFPDYDLTVSPNAWGGMFGDINNDDCLDIFIPHSLTPLGPEPARKTATGSTQHLWQGDCAGGFTDISVATGLSALFDTAFMNDGGRDQSFAGSFVDINNDGWQDLLIAADKATSLVLLNQTNGMLLDITDRDVIDDFNAMGSAIIDVNLDGELDWFSSNISLLNGWHRGNKLYWGVGNGDFVRAPESAGILTGHWGWGACGADFNLDRYPDLLHVNGFYFPNNHHQDIPHGRFNDTPAILFVANGNDTFTEQAAAAGIDDHGEGRGVACFDYDHDGDVDVAISNYKGEFKLYRNDTPAAGSFLHISTTGNNGNSQALGAIVRVRSENPADDNVILTRAIKAGSHFVSASPATAHFGLGDWIGPFEITVHWPGSNAGTLVLQGIQPGQRLSLEPQDDLIYRAGFE